MEMEEKVADDDFGPVRPSLDEPPADDLFVTARHIDVEDFPMEQADPAAETAPPKGATTKPTATEVCLAEALRDLDDAEYHLDFVFGPLRRFVVGPALGASSAILPHVARHVPFADDVMAFAMGVPFGLARHAWCATHSRRFHQSRKTISEMFDPEEARKYREAEKNRMVLGDLRTQVGFAAQAVIEFFSNPLYNLKVWKEYNDRLSSYCGSIGIELGLMPLLKDPFAVNTRILSRVQADKESTEVRRARTAIKGDIEVESVSKVAKLMRYCCASYGRPMMAGYDIIMEKYEPNLLEVPDYLTGGDSLKNRVAEHVGVPVESITHFHLGSGGNMESLRYYISADADLQAVIFVIRGTLSVSQWMINAQAQSRPFCGGEAHSGMADLAASLVEGARAELLEALRANPGYRLIVTGQSLGGGVAPLVNILLHEDSDFQFRSVECHAFSGPPVYSCDGPVPSAVETAISNCVHYANGDDIVPYLSMHNIRRMIESLTAIGEKTSELNFLHAVLIAMGRAPVGDELVDAALNNGGDVEPVPGSPKLEMPAKHHVWVAYNEENGEVNFTVCDPKEFANLSLYLSGQTGISHHVPQNCEFVFNRAERKGWRKNLH